MDYLFVICLAILVFFMVSIMSRKANHLSDKIFTFWLFLVALAEVTFFLSSQNLFHDFHWVYEFACASHVLHGTMFYFYVLSLVNPDFSFGKKHLLHLIPFGIYMGYKTTTKSLGLVDCLEEGGCSHSDNIYAVISVYMKFLIILAYVLTGYIMILKVQKNKSFTKGNPYGVKWISSIGNGVLILLSVVFLIKLLGSNGVHFVIDQVMLINIIVSVFVISFVYIYTKYSYIFAHPLSVALVAPAANNSREQVVVDDENPYDEQFQQICEFIEQKEVYKDGDLTLRKLSAMIDVPEHTISQAINRSANRSYSDFINSYRINYFIHLIEQKAHEDKTLLYLAFDCGFNSKSSFNRVFKQFHDITPTEYIKSKS
ncbi:helix-turn-helix domain-containing protein [Marinifilum caeruleilacunae]|uniref:AraC family transcriptional regulator n=1 Tax=Marinifilum caeruleilacunae TaxID=2499076 RepID=A0ABX1WRH7_9BACT|nr:AraC family transcriptional regulator [Marinifilum caeruleilacunae]NOU58671.1 AraC family transcriptional regulator [Marinifilum caeruleilacunae]